MAGHKPRRQAKALVRNRCGYFGCNHPMQRAGLALPDDVRFQCNVRRDHIPPIA